MGRSAVDSAPTEVEKINPAVLPPALRARIDAAIAMVELDPWKISTESWLASLNLRKRVQRESPKSGAMGCGLFTLVLIPVSGAWNTWFGKGFLVLVLLIVVSDFWKLYGPSGWRRPQTRRLSSEMFREAMKVAGFGPIEWAAIDVVRAPRAGIEVRTEVDLLLAEDARLVAALTELGPIDLDSIKADRLRLRLALARETDPATRAALEASLALCTRRYEAATAALAVRARIDAHRELILQTLRSAGESLARRELEGEEFAAVRENAGALGAEVAAIEQAVQEMRG